MIFFIYTNSRFVILNMITGILSLRLKLPEKSIFGSKLEVFFMTSFSIKTKSRMVISDMKIVFQHYSLKIRK